MQNWRIQLWLRGVESNANKHLHLSHILFYCWNRALILDAGMKQPINKSTDPLILYEIPIRIIAWREIRSIYSSMLLSCDVFETHADFDSVHSKRCQRHSFCWAWKARFRNLWSATPKNELLRIVTPMNLKTEAPDCSWAKMTSAESDFIRKALNSSIPFTSTAQIWTPRVNLQSDPRIIARYVSQYAPLRYRTSEEMLWGIIEIEIWSVFRNRTSN